MGIEFIECYTPPEDVVTCSVKLDFSELADYSYDGVIFHIAYTELGNNGIKFADRTRFDNFQTEMTLENVVMGSVMYLSSKIPIAPRYDVDTSDFTPIWYERGVFCLVPEAEDLTIQFYYDVNEAVDARPDQVEEGVKFVGANGVVEEGEMPIIEVAAPSMTAVVEEGDLYIEACNEQAEGYSPGGKAYNDANIYLTVDGGEATATCKLSNGQNVAIKKSVDRGSLPPPVMVFDTKTGVVQAIVSFEEGGTQGYIDYTSGTSGTYDVSKHIDTSIIKGGETLFGKEGTMPTIALPEATIHFDVDSGRILSVVTNNEDGFVEKGETSAYTYLRTKKAAVIEPSNTTQIAVQKNYWTTGDVTVAPIPDKYKDATGANALPGQVLEGAYFLGADGVVKEGTIRNARFAGYERKVYLDDDDPTGNTFWVNVSQNYTEGYVGRAGRFVADVYPKLEIDGNKVTMECLGAKIERTVGLTVDTCTINVTFSKNAGITLISATTFENGTISVVNQNVSNNNSGRSFSIPNVVCGSALSINTTNMVSLYSSCSIQPHYSLLGGTITVPTAPGTYTVEVGELDD